MSARVREVVGEVDHPCHSCGRGCVFASETRLVLRFWDRLLGKSDERLRRYETCLDCGVTLRVLPVKRTPVGGDPLGGYFPL